jgi:hypothetical protein
MVAFLADLVNTDSGSYNKRGVASVGDRLRPHIEATGVPCEIHFECDLWRFDAEPDRPSSNLLSRRKGAAFSELEVTGGRPLRCPPRPGRQSDRGARPQDSMAAQAHG